LIPTLGSTACSEALLTVSNVVGSLEATNNLKGSRFMTFPCCAVQSAVEALVAVNNLVGLRFMHDEDMAVGLWLSGFYVKYILEHDAKVRFAGGWHLFRTEELEVSSNPTLKHPDTKTKPDA
jgi:hypothetical protein